MKMFRPYNWALIAAVLSTSACDPVSILMGGTVLVGPNATKEKGLKGTISDTWISTKVKSKLYGFNAELHGFVGVNVQEGEVLLTGCVPEDSWVQEAEKLALEVEGVKKVFNHLTVNKDGISISEVASDSAITTHLKGDLLCDGDIKSLNYSIKTVSGIVYLMGAAQSEEELEKVLNYARNIRNVQKVVCYANVKPDAAPAEENASNTPAEPEVPQAEDQQ